MKNEEGLSLPDKNPENGMFVRFMLHNNDTITVIGNSVQHIYFEVHRKFPEGFAYRGIGFSGNNSEDSQNNLMTYFALSRKYG